MAVKNCSPPHVSCARSFCTHSVPSHSPPPAARDQSCWINSIALARTRSSSFSKAKIKGSIDPTGAVSTQTSNALSLVSTSGEARSLAIQAGTTRTSIGFSGFFVDTGSFPGREPFLLSEARGSGLAVVELAAEARRSVREDALSDEAGPQPASPARSIRLMGSARHEQTGSSDGLDRRIPSGLSGDVVNEHITGENTR